MRQPTPRMQLIAILSSVRGWTMNIADGISDPKRAAALADEQLEEAVRLLREQKDLERWT